MKIAFLLFLCLSARIGWAQQLGDAFDGIVRQPDEFIAILNQVPKYPDSLELFNKLLIGDVLSKSGVSQDLVQEFWRSLGDGRGESVSEKNWLAELHCLVSSGNRMFPTVFYLSLMKDSLMDYDSWRIVDASSDIMANDTVPLLAISPESHNVDFLPFGKNLTYGHNNLRGMITSLYDYDELTALSLLFELGLAKVDEFQSHSLYYPDLNGFSFRIERKMNGGEFPSWGITHLIKVEEGQ